MFGIVALWDGGSVFLCVPCGVCVLMVRLCIFVFSMSVCYYCVNAFVCVVIFGCICENLGSIWKHSLACGAFGSIRDHSEASGSIWIHLKAFGSIWKHLGAFGSIGHLEAFGSI